MEQVAQSVLCCADCDAILSTTPNGGKFCIPCNYAPSMQDTYIAYHCPRCRLELKSQVAGWPRSCPNCRGSFSKD